VPKLSKEERAKLEAQLAEDDQAEDDAFEVEIGSEGNYARVPYAKAKTWLGKTFGIDLDDEPKQGDGKDEPAGEGDGKVRRFGRQVG
jgi:hypothetical protein